MGSLGYLKFFDLIEHHCIYCEFFFQQTFGFNLTNSLIKTEDVLSSPYFHLAE